MSAKLSCFLLLVLISKTGWAQLTQPQTPKQQQQQQNVDNLESACAHAAKKDKVCDGILTFHQLGNDIAEVIKEYIHLGPFEYAAVTAINYAINGRIRVRTQSFLWDDWRHVYDYNRDGSYMFYLERDF